MQSGYGSRVGIANRRGMHALREMNLNSRAPNEIFGRITPFLFKGCLGKET
jgi:hypothetical protein